MCALYISQTNCAMDNKTQMAPSQFACADGLESLLHKDTELLLDSSWLQA